MRCILSGYLQLVKGKLHRASKLDLDFAPCNIYDGGTMGADPFAGLGRALTLLRERAGFATQTEASEALKIDKGQLSRWENENPRPSLENLGRALAGYGATLMDLAALIGQLHPTAQGEPEPTDHELIRALADAIRRVEGRQIETEERMQQMERDLRRSTG